MQDGHVSVMTKEVMDGLTINATDIVVDATVGGAGHFREFLTRLGPDGVLIGIDADAAALERASAVFAEDRRSDRPIVHLVEDNFKNLNHILARLNVARIDKALFDLGWSGLQLADGRGFSFQGDEPLLMTYGNQDANVTASGLVNTISEADLADLIYNYGEERYARKIAKAIVAARRLSRIYTTQELVTVISRAVPASYRNKRLHFATKTFQALRVAVNDELGAIDNGLTAATDHLTPRGRIAVITFHSIEDRIVKVMFRDAARAGKGIIITKKVITPSPTETRANPRARSAKLRLFEAAYA